MKLLNSEPAIIAGIINAAVGVLLAFVHFDGGQQAAIIALTAAVMALVVRSQVSPTINLPTRRTK